MKQCQKTWLFIVIFNAIGVWKLNDWVALQMSSILLAATVLYAVIKFDQNVKGEEKYIDKDKVLVFCSQNFEIYIDISIFQAHSKFPSRV